MIVSKSSSASCEMNASSTDLALMKVYDGTSNRPVLSGIVERSLNESVYIAKPL